MRLVLVILAICYVIFFACLYATMSELPARIASHFDALGRPNGWMERGSYLEFIIGMVVGLPLFVVGITAVTGRLGRGMNIPHREYWLAPERRRATVAVMMRYMVAICSVMVLFLTALHFLIVAANANPTAPRMNFPGTWALLGAIMAATGIWCWLLWRRFSRTP
jgi:uncharacterized membrane protein